MSKDNFTAWQYNVLDHFKNKTVEEIRQILKDTAYPFAVCMEHIIGDFNIGTLVRNANAFGARDVYYVGKRRWDRRGSVGTYHYTNLKYLEDFESGMLDLASRYTIIGVDNMPGAVPVDTFTWPDNTLMVFGEEGIGLTEQMLKHCQALVEIPMFGSVRSLNCGTASGIVMYDYVSKFNHKGKVK